MSARTKPVSLAEAIAVVDTPKGRAMLKEYLEKQPYPHFEQHPSVRGSLIRIDLDGRRTAGRFVNREFVPLKERARRKPLR